MCVRVGEGVGGWEDSEVVMCGSVSERVGRRGGHVPVKFDSFNSVHKNQSKAENQISGIIPLKCPSSPFDVDSLLIHSVFSPPPLPPHTH